MGVRWVGHVEPRGLAGRAVDFPSNILHVSIFIHKCMVCMYVCAMCHVCVCVSVSVCAHMGHGQLGLPLAGALVSWERGVVLMIVCHSLLVPP